MVKQKSIKARKLWADRVFLRKDSEKFSLLLSRKRGKDIFIVPVAVLPTDAASYDMMVDQMQKAMYFPEHGEAYKAQYIACAKQALAAIGITRNKSTNGNPQIKSRKSL